MYSRGTIWVAISATIIIAATSLNASPLKQLSLNNGQAKAYAITADPFSPESLLKNPATTGFSNRETFITNFGSHFNNSFSTGLLSWSGRVQNLGIGLSVPAKIIQDIPHVTELNGQGVEVGSFQDIETLAMLSLSLNPAPFAHIGVAASYYYNQILNDTAQGYGIDAGLLLDLGWGYLGVSLQNIGSATLEWSTGTDEKISETINIGLSTMPSDFGRIIADASFNDIRTSTFSAAYELTLKDVFTLQGGMFDIGKSQQITMGCLLQVDSIGFQYSYSPHPDLGPVHKIGVRYEAH